MIHPSRRDYIIMACIGALVFLGVKVLAETLEPAAHAVTVYAKTF